MIFKCVFRGWKTKDKINRDAEEEVSSGEDSEFLEKADEFETRYNFRFEEEGGHAIASHARNVNDSVRVRENSRKRARDDKKARQESDKEKKLLELARLKNLKKQEIDARLKQIEKATGTKGHTTKLLDTEFNPETYDEEMEGFLGPDYYEEPDAENDLHAEEVVEEEVLPEDDAGELWFFCDVCIRPIRPGNIGFECQQCEDTTLCFNCKSQEGSHSTGHTLKKFKVGESEAPPSDWQDVLYQLKKKRVKEITKGKFDELFALDYEDLIAGDVACRFKYTKVDSDAFGLAPEAILTKSDAELNKQSSLRKLHTYRKNHAMKRIKYHDKR